MANHRPAKSPQEAEAEPGLFDWPSQPASQETPQIRHGAILPIWSRNKAQLVAEYLRLFVQITHSGVYIDGFAGPQIDEDCWSARRVLEVKLLQQFHLCDLRRKAVAQLDRLRELHPDRDIHIYGPSDFNTVVDTILGGADVSKATFCLLDQRTFECEWATVVKLARFKAEARYKVELFYFFADRWLDRAWAASKRPQARDKILRWWGGGEWELLRQLRGERRYIRARLVAQRFHDELGYRFAVPWEIRDHVGGNVVMYYMIHATDHPDAPELMGRAYQSVIGDPRGVQLPLFGGEDGDGHLVPRSPVEEPSGGPLTNPSQGGAVT